MPVVIVAAIAPPVVDQPPLVGETVGEIVHRQRQGVVLGRDGGEIGPVGGFLEADELFETFPLVGDLERQLEKGLHVGIGLVGHDASALVENAAQTAQHQQVALRLLPVPGIDEHRTGAGGQPPFQSPPHTAGMRLVGRNVVDALRKKRFGFPGTDQRLGKRPHRVGIEQGRQQPVEGFVISENQHRVRKGSVGLRYYPFSAAAERSAGGAPARGAVR